MPEKDSKDSYLQLVNFYGSFIPLDEYRRLMQDEDERSAYLDYLRD